jgi:hypothetical protein
MPDFFEGEPCDPAWYVQSNLPLRPRVVTVSINEMELHK